MTQKRDAYVYVLTDEKGHILYIGTTNIPAHLRDGKELSYMEPLGPMTEDEARDLEKKMLDEYRRGNRGKNPKYNDSANVRDHSDGM